MEVEMRKVQFNIHENKYRKFLHEIQCVCEKNKAGKAKLLKHFAYV